MKKLISLIALAGTFTIAMAQAAAPATPSVKPMTTATAKATTAPAAEVPPATGQQNRMKTCNADEKAKTLKGDGRKAFMKSCLKGETVAVAGTTPQSRMKSCNVDASAKALKGNDRKAFMSTCLKG
ncbi:hypothetical protein LPB72_21085 [Hydrogenophaga crassostreae]|uniref:Phosphate starvation-inducible protein PsiF n=1 Tax=Hydrogenophaga crassostreae TaxID=1763535 RepID=A0A167GIA4_9BURK|nr:PsiF family protein [Hydrogenophaga crassostreae]AOW15033.1 hypothetical protein LPB072_21700 [Hydrogenophaga crassostreae]OAD39485.1 hypothetical protein LPB72_21085 [Hydrogenophaga crassostreae]